MILVTGANGLLGSHLVQQLILQDQKVRALYRQSIPSLAGAEKIEWIRGDILDVSSLENAMQNVSHVYHCAGMVSFSPKKKKELFKVNVEGTANVVNACIDAEVEKLLFVSSVSALGRIRENEVINETMNWSEETSNSEYGKSKYLAEMQVWRGIGEGLNAVMVNPTIILGAGNWESGSTGIFKTVYDEFPWYTNGVSGFVDLNDVVNAIILVMQSDLNSERFIINGVNIPYKELFDLIAKNFNKKLPSKQVTPFIASIVWRLEKVKAMFKGKDPLLTKESLENLIASFIIFFDKPFFVGDTVKVQGFTGAIEKIGLRSTRIRTEQKTFITVPNKQMVDTIIDNVSMRTQRRASSSIEVGLSATAEQLKNIIEEIEKILIGDAVESSTVFLSDTGKNAHIISIEYFATMQQTLAQFRDLRQQINLQIIDLFNKNKIEFAAASADINVTQK